MTLLRNTTADGKRLRGSPVSRAQRNLFFMLFLLPPQLTPHPWVTRKTRSQWELQFPGLKEEMLFAHTHFTSANWPPCSWFALQETTFASLVYPGACGKRDTKKSPLLLRAARAGVMLGTAGLPRNFGTACSHLWSLILCQSKLLNQINSCSLLDTCGVFSTKGNCHSVLQIHAVPPQH